MSAPIGAVDNAVNKLTKLTDYTSTGMDGAQEIALDIEECTPDSTLVKELEDAMMQFVAMDREMKQWTDAAEKAKRQFQKDYRKESNEIPNMEKLFREHLAVLEAKNKDLDIGNHPRVQEFREKVWNVNHQGEPLPNSVQAAMDEDEDVIVSQAPAEQTKCPITMTEMIEPMRNKPCGHNYDKEAILTLIRNRGKRGSPNCPVAGCPHKVSQHDLEANTALQRHIQRQNRKK